MLYQLKYYQLLHNLRRSLGHWHCCNLKGRHHHLLCQKTTVPKLLSEAVGCYLRDSTVSSAVLTEHRLVSDGQRDLNYR